MSQVAGRVGFTPKGDYNAATTYTMLNVVKWTDGNTYFAKDTTTGNAPSDTNHWQKMTDIVVATVNNLGVVKPDGTSITIDANGVISASVSAGVASFNTRTGAVVPTAGDYDADKISIDTTFISGYGSTVQSALEKLVANGMATKITGHPLSANQSSHTYTYVGFGIDSKSIPVALYIDHPERVTSSTATVTTADDGHVTVTATVGATATTCDIVFVRTG